MPSAPAVRRLRSTRKSGMESDGMQSSGTSRDGFARSRRARSIGDGRSSPAGRTAARRAPPEPVSPAMMRSWPERSSARREKKSDRKVATLAMNHGRHLVTWYVSVAGMGGVVHTANPRLFDDQLIFIDNHAGQVLFYDRTFSAAGRAIRNTGSRSSIITASTATGLTGSRRCSPQRGRRPLGDRQRARTLHDLLHQRHHGQSQRV